MAADKRLSIKWGVRKAFGTNGNGLGRNVMLREGLPDHFSFPFSSFPRFRETGTLSSVPSSCNL
jgi:hypothetical protein